MRRYDDPVEVRRGLVDGLEAPEQFLWRERLWVVCEVLAQWVETGTWWEQQPVRSLLGTDSACARPSPGAISTGSAAAGADLLGEREVWRVEAARGRSGYQAGSGSGRRGPAGRGVFDLSFSWGEGQWRLLHTLD
jgi:uncharacterized protein DUF6504